MRVRLLHTVFQALDVRANYQRLPPLMSRAFAGVIAAVWHDFVAASGR